MGCFTSKAIERIYPLTVIMNAELYKNILDFNLKSLLGQPENKSDYISMQANDPKNKSKIVMKYLKDNNIQLLDWPPQSPDLNPIEHLWDVLKGNVPEYAKESTLDLKVAVAQKWEATPKEMLLKLVHLMPRRLKAVIQAKGGPTKY